MNDMADSPDPARSLPGCPICGTPQTQEFAPFCSKRCMHIDLGRWLGERYVIEGEDGAPGEESDEF